MYTYIFLFWDKANPTAIKHITIKKTDNFEKYIDNF